MDTVEELNKLFIMWAEGEDSVIVTENETRPARPDNTTQQEAAEVTASETIKNLDAGLVSRRTAIRVKESAQRAVGGHDLSRGIKNMS